MTPDRPELIKIKNMLRTHPSGMSIRDLSSRLPMNRNSLAKYLDALLAAGQVEMQTYGTAKVYFLSQKVPISAMLEFSSEFIIVLDEEQNILQVNEPFLQFTGMERENLVGKNIADIPSDIVRSLSLPGVLSPLRNQAGNFRDISGFTNGQEYFLRVKGIPAVFEDGSSGTTLIIEDITSQKQYERQIAASEERYRAIVQDQTEFITRFQPDGTISFLNESFSRYMNMPGAVITGSSFFELIHPEEESFVRAKISTFNTGLVAGTYEFRLLCEGNRWRWHQWTIRGIFDSAGRIIEYQGVGQEIHERREAEERLSRYIGEMKFISSSVMDYVRCSRETEIYALIAAHLREILPESEAILVFSRDASEQSFILEFFIRKKGSDSGKFKGQDLIKREIPAEPGVIAGLRDHKVFLFERGFGSELLLPLHGPEGGEMAHSIDAELKLEYGCLYGLVTEGNLMGMAAVLLPSGFVPRDNPLIWTYINQSSIALKRCIEERKRSESEERFRNVSELSPFPISIIAPDGRYLYINRKFRELFGYSFQEIRNGRDWFRLAFPDEESRRRAVAYWKSDLVDISRGEARSRPFCIRCGNGSRKEIVFHLVTLADDTQFIIYEDITEALKVERTKNLLASIVNSSNDAIIGKTVDGIIVSWNPGAERLYGYPAEEIIGKDIRILVPPERHREIDRILEQVRNGEQISHYEAQRLRKDGTLIDVSVNVSPIKDDKGNIRGASSIIRDITATKAERRLKEIEERYRTLVENISVGVYRSTGDPKGRFIWGNSTLVHILGYSSLEELRGIAVTDIFVESGGRKELLRELKEKGFVKNRQVHLQRRGGGRVWVQVTALARFSASGDIAYINGIIEDITDRKILEQELQEARAMVKEFEALHSSDQELYRESFICASEGIAVLDHAGKILLANLSFCRTCTGAGPESVQGENIARFIAEEDRRRVLDGLQKARKSGPVTMSYGIGSPKGRIRVETSITPVKDRDGRISRVLAVQRGCRLPEGGKKGKGIFQ